MNWRELRLGSTNLLAATVAQAVAVLHFYSLGMFFEPLQQSFGWSRTLIASGLTVSSVVAVIGAPFVGMLIDRIGPRRVGLVGILLYSAAIACFSLMTSSIIVYYALWILLALAALSVKTTVWITEIVCCFVQHRGIAIAVVLSGTGMGAIAIPALARYYIAELGWRGAYMGLGASAFLIAAPLIFLFFGKSRKEQAVDAPKAEAAAPQPLGKQIFSRAFLQLASVAVLVSLCLVAISVHLIPIVGERGIDRVEGAKIASLLGASALFGRLATGTMLDRWSPRVIGTIVIGLGLVGVALMGVASSPQLVWIAVVFLGISLGAELDIVAFLAARLFGQQRFATLFGIIVGILSLCTGVGPLAAAVVFDITGSYDLWFWISGAALALAAVLIATLQVTSAAEAAG
jgi:MFS family permease